MAVNETIVTNRYFRRCTDAANKVWQRISFWHKASDCEFDDGSTAQTKVGAIKGITTSTSVTETGYAADMTTVKGLQTQIDELNSNLSKQISFKKLHSSAQDSGITNVSVSGYSQYLLVMCYGSNNDNPLDWGCSTSRGTTVQLGQQRSSRTSVAGACSAYIINVGDKNSVNISCRYHNNGATMIFGIE